MSDGPTDLDDRLTLRLYQPGDEVGLLALFNEVFSEDDPSFRHRTMDEWRWEFLDQPGGSLIVVCLDGERVIAQYPALAMPTLIRGERRLVHHAIDSLVQRDYRRGLKRKGVFLRMAETYFAEHGCMPHTPCTYGFPNSKALRIGTKRLGYTPVFAPVRTLGRNLPNFADDAAVGRGADRHGEIVEVDRFGAEADALWAKLAPRFGMAAVRDAAFLNWRFTDCPFGDYRAFALVDPDGTWRAYWVLRPDWQGPPILAIADWLWDDTDEGVTPRVLAHVCRRARDTGQLRVEVWAPPHRAQFGQIQSRGFTAEDCQFNLCIRIHDDELLDAGWVGQNWHYTIADSDVF